MTWRLRTRDASGLVTFDSTQAQVGCLVEVLVVPAGPAATRTYPAFAGRNAAAVQLSGSIVSLASVDTALGYPRVVLPAGDPVPAGWAVFVI